MSEIRELKRIFEEYEKARNEFRETHNPIKCCHCEAEINPGDDVIVLLGGDKFCSFECFAMAEYGEKYIFNINDDDYCSCFPEKERQ